MADLTDCVRYTTENQPNEIKWLFSSHVIVVIWHM